MQRDAEKFEGSMLFYEYLIPYNWSDWIDKKLVRWFFDEPN